ncbi:MAG: lipoyl synthase [Chloroflexi bacterium]|nr:lipoyl synthase [Chloroflexota bacterium]
MPERPDWLVIKAPRREVLEGLKALTGRKKLHTVCESAMCPNVGECFSHRNATFMILGDECTRNCRFCAVHKGHPLPPDPEEPRRVAEAIRELALVYAVITSVTRDDLPLGGSEQFAATVRSLKELCPGTLVELLIPDFLGSTEALRTVVQSEPDVLGHNLETVPSLYQQVRPLAVYQRSLEVLTNARKMGADSMLTKSGLMLGLGERREEVLAVLRDLRAIDCDIVTLGQYLRPSQKHLPILEYISPEQFEEYRLAGLEMGFKAVASAPLVRSSFRADAIARDLCQRG